MKKFGRNLAKKILIMYVWRFLRQLVDSVTLNNM